MCVHGYAQAPDLLSRKVNLNFRNLSQREALEVVAREGGFQWSYNARLLDPGKRVSIVAERILLREALYRIMGDEFTYKQNEGYVILKRAKKQDNTISGYIVDPQTGARVQNATVYDRKSLRATQTDKNGYYELKVGKDAQVVISKLAYRDTVLLVSPQNPRVAEIDLQLAPQTPPTSPTLRKEWALLSVRMERYFTTTLQRVNAMNVNGDLQKPFQFSILPNIGTNRLLGPNISNSVSLNATVGYSGGSRALEIGGIGNIDRYSARGVQIAGGFNGVGGEVSGVQLAGVLNHAGDTLRGMQIAGMLNIAKTASWSGQAAGMVNVAGNGRMLFQAAGVSNVADSLYALQVSALTNHTFGYFQGIQVAGLVNTASHSKAALQFAGLVNIASHGSAQLQATTLLNVGDTVHGIQAAGMVNVARKVNGLQIGLINVARKANGLQIGLVNRAKTINGMQIGLLNFARRGGYNIAEGGTNDVTTWHAAYKSGTGALYTIFTAGLRPDTSRQLWTYGVGLGTRLRLSRHAAFTLEGIHRHVNFGTSHNSFRQEWSQGLLSLELKIAGGLALAAGVSANAVFGDENNPSFVENRPNIVPKAPWRTIDYGDARFSGWLGWSLSVRAGVFPRKKYRPPTSPD